MAHRKQWTDNDKAQWQAQTEERTAALLERLEAGVLASRPATISGTISEQQRSSTSTAQITSS